MDVILNIMQVVMGYVAFVSSQHDSFIKCVKWVGSSQLVLLTSLVFFIQTSLVRVEGSLHDY